MQIRYGNEPQLTQTTLLCNTGEGGLFSNVSSACKRHMHTIGSEAVVCGGGPSLEDSLESIRTFQASGAKVFALNNVAQFLVNNGIKPDYQVLVDPRPDNVSFIQEAWAGELLIASQCHPSLFDHAEKIGYRMTLWHPALPGIDEYIRKKGAIKITSNITVGLSVLSLVHTLGHRTMHLFGYDSSHKVDASHAYRQDINKKDEIVRCAADSKVFYASMAMAGQAAGFREMLDMLEANECDITVHGDGLLPTMWRSWQREKSERVLTAFYDLGVSPPSYDFLSFLVEAERYRRANGFTDIDLIFNPGPMHGFRDDDLPPDVETRTNMLWGVCVAMARRLPSVRNIEVKKRRWQVSGDVFPVGYEESAPRSHYATAFLRNGEPMLKATDYARRQVAMRFSKPYATISLREAKHWPQRNSNRKAWIEVAQWLLANNIQPVVVPDTDSTALEGFAEYQAASVDIDLRCALYEGAAINLGVLNGPMSLCAFLDCRYLIFNVGGENMAAGSTAFLQAHGFSVGEGFGGNGRLIWEKDEAEVILRELREFELTEKTS